MLLSAFLLQAAWLSHVRPLSRVEVTYVRVGLDQLHGAFVDANVPAAAACIAAIPGLILRDKINAIHADVLKWIIRLPFIAVGWLLGASVWYVSRRLYGNPGGYLALTLYCFSPMTFFAFPNPVITGALGAFGVIFVAIASAHTLYAPHATGRGLGSALRELSVRRRRIILLGLAVALAVGSAYWLAFLLILAEAYMVYIVPERQFDAVLLMLVACVIALVVLFAFHGFHWKMLWYSLANGQWFPRQGQGNVIRAYLSGMWRTANPGLLGFCISALVVYSTYRRSRYFGNAAPLIATLYLMALGLMSMTAIYAGPFPLVAIAFLFVFIAGVFADLLETQWRVPTLVFTLFILGIYIMATLIQVLRTRYSVLY
jgi:hypothetical protein